MKSLNYYTDAPIAAALKTYGAFYAFSNEQFLKQKQPDVVYQRGPSGLIIPKDNVDNLIDAMRVAIADGIAARMAEYPIDEIIAYELANYECYYTGQIDDAVDALQPYNVTYDQVMAVYQKNKRRL